MYSEILKIVPRLDPAAMKKMQSTLQSRFTKIAKGFGNSMKNIFKGGGWLGAALGLINKILNPLQETTEAIERTLKNSADIVTNAQQFGTTAGRLYKLQKLAQSKGIDEGELYNLIGKFQTSIAEAKADPTAPSAVRQYANETDMAAAFFEFIQAIQKMDKNQQVLVQQAVFGEKQILKMASFLQTDFGKRVQELGLAAGDRYTPRIEKLDKLSDLSDVLRVRSQIQDEAKTGDLITTGMIHARQKAADAVAARTREQIKGFENLQAVAVASNKIMGLVDQGVAMLGQLINFLLPTINRLVQTVEKFANSPAAKGIFKYFGKGD